MPKAIRGDEQGLLWQRHIYIGRSAANKVNLLTRIAAPEWKPPTEFRSILGLPRIGLDIETHDPELKEKGPGAKRANTFIVGVAVGYAAGDSQYYPTAHDRGNNMADVEGFYDRLRQEALEYDGFLCGANLQYDLYFLKVKKNVTFPKAKIADVLIYEPLIDENKLKYDLQSLSRKYLKKGKVTDQMVEVYGKDYIKNMRHTHPGHVALYAEGDTDLPLSIMDLQQVCIDEEGLGGILDIEQRLIPLLLHMKETGVRVDLEKAEIAYREAQAEAHNISDQLKNMAGRQVDVWSSESVAKAFSAQGIPYPMTAAGNASFRKDWLEAHPAPIAQLIVKQRSLEKISGTFIKNYIIEGHVDGRIHCSFNQLRGENGGAVTGRFSSSNPNLQNIPVRDPFFGPLLRSMFIPEHDHDWGSADWSQIEFRFLVHYAVAAGMVGAAEAARMYKEDATTDFHKLAAGITGKPRAVAKNINFGVVYGMGVRTMAANLGGSIDQAERTLDEFHQKLPFLKGTYELYSRIADDKGFITTIEGRRRRFHEWELPFSTKAKPKGMIRGSELKKLSITEIPDALKRTRELHKLLNTRGMLSYDEVKELFPDFAKLKRLGSHKALNAQLQGSAADLMKKAMVNMWESGIFSVLVPHLTVHDEMDVSIPRTKAGQEAFKELIYIMENTIKLNVPIIADAKIGANWSECK